MQLHERIQLQKQNSKLTTNKEANEQTKAKPGSEFSKKKKTPLLS